MSHMGAAPPLASIGILSAASYRYRRAAARESWLTFDEVKRGKILTRFVIAVVSSADGNETTSDARSLDDDASCDTVYLPTNGSLSRIISPLATTFAWLKYATIHHIHRRSQFILKCDDDAYVFVPGLATHMRMMLKDVARTVAPHESNTSAAKQSKTKFAHLEHLRLPLSSHIYFGRLYWTNYHPGAWLHVATGYAPDMARKMSDHACAGLNCTGPFPFATGSMQGLSIELARALASSSAAAENVRRGVASLASSKRKTPAFEDAWLGYAMVGLLPPDSSRRISVVGIDPLYSFGESAS